MGEPPHHLPDALIQCFERSRVALALSTAEPDVPLVLVNAPFCELTGYGQDEIVGQNCRFLQGPDSTEAEKRELHDFIHTPEVDDGRFRVLNYRKDGSSFENLVFMSRLRDDDGIARYIFASQFDMSPIFERERLENNDRELNHDLRDIERIGRQHGLAMLGSARQISDSLSLIARLSLRNGS